MRPKNGYGTPVPETLTSEQVPLMKKLLLVSRDLLSGFTSSKEAVEQNRAGGGRHKLAARLEGAPAELQVAKTGLFKPLGVSQELVLHPLLLVNASKVHGYVSMACPCALQDAQL